VTAREHAMATLPGKLAPVSGVDDPKTAAETITRASELAPTIASGRGASPEGELLTAIDHGRRYRDTQRLGIGGMGEVRLCEDQLIGREVALKVIHGERGADDDAVQRFLREARVQARLEHPAIVPIHDLGRTSDGRVYFTMKRVRGRTLAEIVNGIAKGDASLAVEFSRRKLLAAFVSVCQAVELAHQRGVVHRDLKPSNIMLGDFGEVYVLDWGIARIDGDAEVAGAASVALSEAVLATEAGAIVGTPGYMAPEQVRGDLDAVGACTDIYSLGAILFELLALEPLHPRASATAIFASTLAGAEASPARRAPHRDVPPELDALCVRATALEPADRFSKVRELVDAVERFLDGDRDLALRRRMSEEHADQATEMVASALASDDEQGRARALRETGRALALDADNEKARHAMVRLMTTPPKKVPAEAAATLEASAVATQRFAARMGIISYLLWLTAIPIGWWMGVENTGLYVFFIVGQLSALIGCAWLLRTTKSNGLPVAAAIFGVWLATLSLVFVFGPLLLVPGVVGATMTMALLHPTLPSRRVIIAMFSAIVAVPVTLELAGVIAPSYRFVDGVLITVPRMVRHPEAATLLALVFGSMATLAVLAATIVHIRRMLNDAEQRVQLHAWQLRQLVP
jgi:serine/threonine protein kinase